MSHLAPRQNAAHQHGERRGTARESAANKPLVASDGLLFWGSLEPAGSRARGRLPAPTPSPGPAAPAASPCFV